MSKLISNAEFYALEFRKVNGLGDRLPIDFNSLLLNLNILTLFRPLSSDFSGMCLKDPMSDSLFMLINSNNSKGRQHFTIAHELYHLFFDDEFTPHKCNPGEGSTTASEKSADAFAAALLMPQTGLSEFVRKSEDGPILATVLKLEQYYSVSRAALLLRLQQLRFINRSKQDKLSQYPVIETALEYGYDTALYNSANEGLVIGDYGEVARGLFDKEKISEGHYLELLNKIKKSNNNGK